ncbi:MAG: hypothetical protein J1F43_03430 [Muribaculaceae bacterium]|nr:hypothetical protein [Muribaculaceae bacterium]
MRKLFTTLLTLSLAFSGMTAYAVNEGTNPYAPKGEAVIGKTQLLYKFDNQKKNVVSGSEIGAPEGWTFECTNREKNIEQSSSITVEGNKYASMKLSNGAVHTVTLPEGYVANAVTIYSVSNVDATTRECFWAKVGVDLETPEVGYLKSYKDYTNPDVSYFKLSGDSNTFDIKNSGEQVVVVLVVDYSEPTTTDPTEPEDPVELTHVVAHNIEGVENTGYVVYSDTENNTTNNKEKVTINGKEYICIAFGKSWNAGEQNHVELKPEGGLKEGDVITFTGCTNVTDENNTKKGAIKISTTDGTALSTSADFPNLKTGASDHGTHTYTLTKDYESLVLSRSGNTKTLITTLAVTRVAGTGEGNEGGEGEGEGEGPTTSIDTISSETETVIYDLFGRRVQNPSNGIFIINGKKVLVK